MITDWTPSLETCVWLFVLINFLTDHNSPQDDPQHDWPPSLFSLLYVVRSVNIQKEKRNEAGLLESIKEKVYMKMETQRQDSTDSCYGSIGHYDESVIHSIADEINLITSSLPLDSNGSEFSAAIDSTFGDDSVFGTGNGL